MKNLKFRLKTKIRHRIKLNKRVLDFNKEVLIGEIGAIVGATSFWFSWLADIQKFLFYSNCNFSRFYFWGKYFYAHGKNSG